jgi:hypothetical protein
MRRPSGAFLCFGLGSERKLTVRQRSGRPALHDVYEEGPPQSTTAGSPARPAEEAVRLRTGMPGRRPGTAGCPLPASLAADVLREAGAPGPLPAEAALDPDRRKGPRSSRPPPARPTLPVTTSGGRSCTRSRSGAPARSRAYPRRPGHRRAPRYQRHHGLQGRVRRQAHACCPGRWTALLGTARSIRCSLR